MSGHVTLQVMSIGSSKLSGRSASRSIPGQGCEDETEQSQQGCESAKDDGKLFRVMIKGRRAFVSLRR
jgi:hypothetical protein